MKRIAVIAGAALASLIGHGAAQGTMADLDRYAKAQAGPTRTQRKRMTRGAARDLSEAQGVTIVLKHVHPRWLREAAAQALDNGEHVDGDWLEARRRMGP